MSGSQEPKERPVRFESLSGIPIERLYTPESLGDWSYADKLGRPGEYPFTRGVYPTMYRGRLWTMRMFAGFGRPEDCLLYTSPSPRDRQKSRMPSSA